MQGKREKPVYRAVKIWAGAAFAAFLAAAAIYLVLLQIEKNILEGYEKEEVYRARQEVPAGQFLTAENLDDYFELVSVDTGLIPEKAMRSAEQITDRIAGDTIDSGVILTEGMLRTVEEITLGMEEPVVAGFRAEDLYQVAGGTLRAGDRIHIYGLEEELGTYLIWENVYVQQVFDSAGAGIESGDKTTCAQMVNIFLDRCDVEAFYTRLEQGSLRVVKVWRQGGVG